MSQIVCRVCHNNLVKSTVTEGPGTQANGCIAPFFDNDGKQHIHDRNVTTKIFRCSNGHQWDMKVPGSCWCGWPSPPPPPVPATKAA